MTEDIQLFVDRLVKTKLDCGKSLIELTTYKGIDLWWFADYAFYRFIKDIIIDNGKENFNPRLIKSIRRIIEYLLDFSLFFLTKFLFSIYKKRKKDDWVILFTAQNLQWRAFKDNISGDAKKTDVFFDSILKILINNDVCKPIGIYLVNLKLKDFINNIRILIEKLKYWYVLHIPLEYYWSPSLLVEETKAIRHFRKIWDGVKDDSVLIELCKYNNSDLYEYIKKELNRYFLLVYPLTLKYIKLETEILVKESPKLVMLLNEYNFFERAVVTACKMKNIPTVAIQHGVITPTHYGYIHRAEDKGRIPLPDMTCVYGTYHYHLLTEKSIYTPSQVLVTGSPRYDILFTAQRLYSKKTFVNKSKIDLTDKIILWTTQCHGLSYKENVENLTAVIEAIKSLNDVTLIIKQHPGERDQHTNMITDFIKKYDCSNVILVPIKSDTYELEFVCDLMITKTSTTAMEAIALNKPVIILNLSGEPDTVEYVEEGVAIGVYKPEDLRKAIKKLLVDDSDLAKNREGYVRRYLYKIDGNASERVVKLIKELR